MKDMVSTTDVAPIKDAFYKGLRTKADGAVKAALNVQSWTPVDSAGMGDLHWFWNNTGTFNTATWDQFNNVLQYNPDGYLQTTAGAALNTGLFNLYNAMAYELSSEDTQKLNAANQQAQAILNTVVSDYTSLFGALPADKLTPGAKLQYITDQIMSWGDADLKLSTFRQSTNPTSLLPDAPLGTGQLISDFMSYLTQTEAAASVQNAVASYNAQIAQCKKNLSPTPTTAKPGWMNAMDVNGNASILPFLTIAEPTDALKNALDADGNGFSISMSVTKIDQQTSSVSVEGSAGVAGWIDFFHISAGANVSYNAFSFDQSVTQVDLQLSYKGVTKFTPQLSASAYDIGTGTGWWNPKLVQDAANHKDGVSGVAFTTPQHYNFAKDGDFGVLDVLAISQLPTITMVFHNATEESFSKHFSEETSWNVSFLGISLASGSQSYTSSEYKYNKQEGTVTVTMAPPPVVTPGNLMTAQAYVIGANCAWPGAQ